MKALPAAAVALTALASLSVHPSLQAKNTQGTHAKHIMLTPHQIKWMDAPPALPKGAKIAVLEGDPGKPGPLTLRLKMPANYRIPPHRHPDTEKITVLSGDFHVGSGSRFNKTAATVLPAGSFTVLPQGGHHFAWTSHGAVVQVSGQGPWRIEYLNPKDDPRHQS